MRLDPHRGPLFGVAAALALAACGGSREDFIGTRAIEACDQTWPVCDRVVGCIVGEQSFVTGRFPGKGMFIVRIPEAATITVGLFTEGVGGTGTDDTYIHWWEGGCTKRIRQAVPAAAFIAEVDRLGVFERSADMVDIGDHLIEFSSDAQATYYARVSVTLKRDQVQVP